MFSEKKNVTLRPCTLHATSFQHVIYCLGYTYFKKLSFSQCLNVYVQLCIVLRSEIFEMKDYFDEVSNKRKELESTNNNLEPAAKKAKFGDVVTMDFILKRFVVGQLHNMLACKYASLLGMLFKKKTKNVE